MGLGVLTEPCGRTLQQGMLFTAWCLWHGASTTVVTAMSLLLPSLLPQPLACMPHSSSRGFSVLRAPNGQHPLSCCLLAAQPLSRELMCPRKALQHCQIAEDALLG